MTTTAITADMVKKLRDQTGAGMMECKNALTEAGGDFEEATTVLRKRGLASAGKKAGRATKEGLIGNRLKISVSHCENDNVVRVQQGVVGRLFVAVELRAIEAQLVERARDLGGRRVDEHAHLQHARRNGGQHGPGGLGPDVAVRSRPMLASVPCTRRKTGHSS